MNHFDYSNIISLVKKKNKINFIGPPGSGKTTLCRKISKELNTLYDDLLIKGGGFNNCTKSIQ